MDKHQAIFIEEANEQIDEFEIALLSLEKNMKDQNMINEVFRVMHSLKGSSGMFGFNSIGEITHHLENIFDFIRDGKLQVSKDILDSCLATVDHLRALIKDQNLDDKNNQIGHDELLTKFIHLSPVSDELVTSQEDESILEQETTYYISVKPFNEIFINGTNPLYLIDDLLELGEGKAIVNIDRIPTIDELNPLQCYVHWEVILSTTQPITSIQDVFIFVENECEVCIEPVCDYNLLRFGGDRLKKYELKEHESLHNYLLELAEEFTGQVTPELTTTETTKTSVQENNDDKSAKSISSIRVSSDKLDELMNLVSELVTTQAGLTLYSEDKDDRRLEVLSENIEKLSRQLRDTAFSMTLIPMNTVFSRFERLIRDLSFQLDKKVDFISKGGETELDKSIIEVLSDPLMHILRNSLDHGIESEAERTKAGKSAIGNIKLTAYYSGANVHIQIKDDGKGIDPEVIRKKAIGKGLIEDHQELSKQEIFELLFAPGFSTATEVTDVSGRGVGMDVVRKNVMNLRGEIKIDSQKGEGTVVEIILPLTLSIIDGLLVQVESTNYVIPLEVIEKCYEVDYKSLKKKFNQLLVLDDQQIPFVNLRKQFKADKKTNPEFSKVIVVHNGEQKIGICVDSIVGEYQAVLKPVGKYYQSQEFVSGATILGDGTIALVLDTYRIIEQKVNQKILAA